MTDPRMMEQITSKPGFLAALDQSGGSTPGALRTYGVADGSYSSDDEMFRVFNVGLGLLIVVSSSRLVGVELPG